MYMISVCSLGKQSEEAGSLLQLDDLLGPEANKPAQVIVGVSERIK